MRLAGGEGFAVDASLIMADANRQKGIAATKGLPPAVAASFPILSGLHHHYAGVLRVPLQLGEDAVTTLAANCLDGRFDVSPAWSFTG
jgi:hypothetical protein